MNSSSQLICLTLPGYPDPAIAIAASRSGALGVLDLEYTCDLDTALTALARLARLGKGQRGVKIDLSNDDFASALIPQLPEEINTIVVARPCIAGLADRIQALQDKSRCVLVEATDALTAAAAAAGGAAGVILKGNEAGGRVGEETTFVLFQRCTPRLSVPLWVHGGVGAHSAAACIAAGAAGVVLDWQLSLTRESPLPQCIKDRLTTMDGSETITIGGGQLGDTFRVYAGPGLSVIDAIVVNGQRLLSDTRLEDLCARRWRDAVTRHVGGASLETLLLLSQDTANPFAGVADLLTNGGKYRYNSLQAEIRRRFTGGFSLQANYTFQKILTDVQSDQQTRFDPFLDVNNQRLDYARADYDRTHTFNFNTIYELPFGSGKRWLKSGGWVERVFGGFQFSSIINISSGPTVGIIDPRGTFNRGGRSGRQTANSSLTPD